MFMKKIDIVANKSDRVLKVLEKECPDILYSALTKALKNKDIIIEGVRTKENLFVPTGSKICVFVDDNAIKRNMFEIVYEDNNVIFVNKGKGIETCDGAYNVADELSKMGKNALPVHRLDRNTLGLVIFAKSQEVQTGLITAFKNGEVEKLYYAEVCGNPPSSKGTLKGYLVKDKDESRVMIYSSKVPSSQEIATEFSVIKSSGGTHLLSIKIKDGKTHQIRAHLAYNKMYIIGDGKYGKNEINSKYKAKTQHLKAYKILFNIHNNKELEYLNTLNIELDGKF